MKQILLSQEKVTLVDDEDYEYLNQWKWYTLKDSNGLTYYAVRNTYDEKGNRYTMRMHRLLLGVTDSKILVDHKDHDGLNNQRSNIRIATASQNTMNTSPYGTSKYLGVSVFNVKRGNKTYQYWRARIKLDDKSIFLGQSKDETKAAILYNIAAKKYFGEFANLNII